MQQGLKQVEVALEAARAEVEAAVTMVALWVGVATTAAATEDGSSDEGWRRTAPVATAAA